MSEPVRKPQLELCLDRLEECCRNLREAHHLYQRLKNLLQQGQADPAVFAQEAQAVLLIPGIDAQIPLNFAPLMAELPAIFEDQTDVAGERIIELWADVQRVSQEAYVHCQTAAQQAAPPQNMAAPAPAGR